MDDGWGEHIDMDAWWSDNGSWKTMGDETKGIINDEIKRPRNALDDFAGQPQAPFSSSSTCSACARTAPSFAKTPSYTSPHPNRP